MTVLTSLREIVGDTHVFTSLDDVRSYVSDWRGLYTGRPLCVIRPGNVDECASVVRLCHEQQLAIVPQGGNTGLAAGAVPDDSGREIVLSLARMNRIRRVDPVGMTIELEAGCVLKTAQDAASSVMRMLPISFAAEGTAQVGGIISTNAGGVNVLRYGMTRQLVLGLEVVRADGTILRALRHLRKDNAGYDWKQLFIGSEGTLGITTAAVLRLVPAPRHKVTSLLSVADLDSALALLKLTQDALGDTISSFEIMSRQSLDLVRTHFGLAAPFDSGEWVLLLEAAASLPGLREAVENVLAGALDADLALDCVIAESEDQAARLWNLREFISEAEHRAGGTLKHDISVPISSVPAFVREAMANIVSRVEGARASIFGHIGDGNLHFNVMLPAGSDKLALSRTLHDLVIASEGSISAEHGIGQYRVEELERNRSPQEMELLRTLKRSLDPSNTLNPNKVLRRVHAT
jgi:FAD/FMN-containing dehydrogenase